MKSNRMLPPICKFALSLAVLGAGVGLVRPAFAAPPKRSAIKAGQVILYLQAGTAKADADALAALVNATEAPMLLPDCYLLTLDNNSQTENATTAAAAKLRPDPRVRWVNPDMLGTSTQTSIVPKTTPNDPRYAEQWGLVFINMPEAWVLQKGVVNVNAAVIDSGFDELHEDLLTRFSSGSFDLTTMTANPAPDGTGPELQHGTHVSGIIVANADNGKGVASVTWQNAQVVGLKVHKKGDPDNSVDGAATVNALQYCADNKDKYHIVTINMSIGFSPTDPNDTTNPMYQALKNCTDKGIIACSAASNDNADNHMVTPAAFNFSPLLLTISAIGQTGKKSSFSSFGKVNLAAPGGDFDNGNAGQILSTLDGAYDVESGTSQATPHATGVATLLMSIPGVTPLQAVTTLRNTANHAGLTSLPDINSGYGILDAYAAISLLSTRVSVTLPDGVNLSGQSSDPANVVPLPVETFKPLLSFHIANVPCDNVTFTLDPSVPTIAKTFTLTQLIAGNLPSGITDFVITGACSGVPNPQYDVSFRVIVPTTGAFQHMVTITGTNPSSGLTSTDTRLFSVTAHTIPSGLSMTSIPYYESPADAPAPFTGTSRDVGQLLGTNVTVYRYLLPATLGSQTGTVSGPYAKFTASDPKANINATFHPTDTVPTLSMPLTSSTGSVVDTRPIGLGFFVDAPAAIPVFTFGQSFTHSAVNIPLHEGWNMIGDPYSYAIPFNSVAVQTTTGGALTIGQASDQGLILPHIYRLVNGDYQFATLPDGTLQAWEAQWVYVVPKDPTNLNPGTVLSLVMTPTPAASTAGRAIMASANTAITRTTGSGGWKLQLAAHVNDKSDANNFVGMSGGASDSLDKTKVPKPPRPDSTVSLSLVRPDAPAMTYAQDLRSLAGTKQWNIVVATDKPNTNVTIEWPNSRSLPKNYSLILTDQVTGRSIDVRNSSSYQFNSGTTPGPRSFSLVARSTAGISGHPLFTNIIVNPSRAGGGRAAGVYNISYNLSAPANVAVSIMTAGGHPVAQIVGRAVAAGDNSLTWNGADDAGRPLGAGAYLMQFQAATTDGQTTRTVHPLIITGR